MQWHGTPEVTLFLFKTHGNSFSILQFNPNNWCSDIGFTRGRCFLSLMPSTPIRSPSSCRGKEPDPRLGPWTPTRGPHPKRHHRPQRRRSTANHLPRPSTTTMKTTSTRRRRKRSGARGRAETVWCAKTVPSTACCCRAGTRACATSACRAFNTAPSAARSSWSPLRWRRNPPPRRRTDDMSLDMTDCRY